MKILQILLKKHNTQNFENTLSFHGYHGNSARHVLVNCMSKNSPLNFRKSREVSSIFSQPCRSYSQKKNPWGVGLMNPPPPRLDRVKSRCSINSVLARGFVSISAIILLEGIYFTSIYSQNALFQHRGACFRPYSDFLSLHTKCFPPDLT